MKAWSAPLAVHERLLKTYGPQGWWPVTPVRGTRPAYRPGCRGRLSERQRLEVCVGAILTQNTNWANVEKAIAGLHQAGVRDLKDYLSLPRKRLERLIRPSGYFRQKAIKLKGFARHLERLGIPMSQWLSGDLKTCRQELLSLHGIGPETADSVLLYAVQRPAFVVDAYTLRIGKRLGWWRAASYERARIYCTKRLPLEAALYNELHALLVVLAKRQCRKTPVCAGCPLKEVCCYGRSH